MLTLPVKKYILSYIGGNVSTSGSSYLNAGYYLGLSSTEPSVNGGTASECNFTEPDASTGYARIYINSQYGSPSGPVYPFEWSETTGADAYKEVWNKYEIHFNVAIQNWGAAVSYVGIFDSSGRLLAFGNIVDNQGEPTSITVLQGHTPTIAQHQAKISLVDIQ